MYCVDFINNTKKTATMHSKQYEPTLGVESSSKVNSDKITSAFDTEFQKPSVRGWLLSNANI